MPLPTGVTSVTVTGHYQRGDGNPATGFVSFLPAVPVLDPAGPAILPAVPVTVPLGPDGAFSTALAATDDTGTSPSGWTYTVVETLDGAVRRSYAIEVPKASAPTVDLSALTPAVPATGVVSYATTAQLAAKVQRSGDTMTGALILAADPVTALGAATKQYSDLKLPLAGGTMTGPLTLSGGSSNLVVGGTTTLTGALTAATHNGSAASGGSLTLNSTSNAAKGSIFLGANSAYDQVNDRFGIGVTAPSTRLHISSALSEVLATLVNTNASLGSGGLFKLLAQIVANGFQLGLNGDTIVRYNVKTDGTTEWGPGGSGGRDTNLYRAAADQLATDDDLLINLAGKGLRVKEGTNAKMGVATLVGGAVTVSTTAVTGSSRIFLMSQSLGGTAGFLRVSGRVAGTSFAITSSSASDTSVVAWLLVEPA